MSTYYTYVNHTRLEFVDLGAVCHALGRAAGHGEDAAVTCAGTLAYLMLPVARMLPVPRSKTGYRGRWGSAVVRDDSGDAMDFAATIAGTQAVAIVADSDVDRTDLDEYEDITQDLIAEMKESGRLEEEDAERASWRTQWRTR